MGLFGKKKEEQKSCCCASSCTPETMAKAETGKEKRQGNRTLLPGPCAPAKGMRGKSV